MQILDAGFRVTSTPSTCSSISPAMVHIITGREDRRRIERCDCQQCNKKSRLVMLGYPRRRNGFCALVHPVTGVGHTSFRLPVEDSSDDDVSEHLSTRAVTSK